MLACWACFFYLTLKITIIPHAESNRCIFIPLNLFGEPNIELNLKKISGHGTELTSICSERLCYFWVLKI